MNHLNKMRLAVFFCSLAVLIILSACGSDETDRQEESVTLTISAAASLTMHSKQQQMSFMNRILKLKQILTLAAQALCGSKSLKERLQTCSFLHQQVILIR
jgi:hypothetical protein